MIYNLVDKYLMNSFSKAISEKINSMKIEDLIIFDVGCYQGNFSRSLKKLLNKKAKFYLFDPNPNLKINDFDTTQLAFSNKIGMQDYYINNVFPAAGSSIDSTMRNDSLWNITRKLVTLNMGKNYKKLSIKTNTLDNFCNTKNIKKITVLKIDAEGHDDKVLEGAKNILKNTKFVQVEVLDAKENYNNKFLKIKKILEDLGNFQILEKKNIWSVGIFSNLKASDVLFVKDN
jgi:FkbM family methyltransferase